MIGQIVLGLLAVVCLTCTSTEAQQLSTLPPTLHPNVVRACNSYTPKASFGNITGFAYAAESSAPLDCLSLNVQPLVRGVLYNSTISYNNNGSLTTPPSSLLLEDPEQPGLGQAFDANSDGILVEQQITVVVGLVGDSSGFQGYALVACQADGSNQIDIFVKNKPPQDEIVKKLKDQLKDNSLQDAPLKAIVHGDSCKYPSK